MSERDENSSEPEGKDPDSAASAAELAAAQRLREDLAGVVRGRDASPEVELVMALRAAWAPNDLTRDENRALIDRTPVAAETANAHALRDALEARREPSPGDVDDAFLARALRAAYAPTELDPTAHRAIIDRALGRETADRAAEAIQPQSAARETANATNHQVAVAAVPPRQRPTRLRVSFGMAAGGLALAASVTFLVSRVLTPGGEAPLSMTRTTQPLFDEPFRAGEASARIDRIASARASDFRDNRFARWGVR